jgi:DNA-directed RNA polymerase subunit RPC12/RpoP
MKTKSFILLVLLIISLLTWSSALAQSENDLQLSLNRDWGYGGFGEIQGLFSMSVKGPDTLQRVVFMIDGSSIGEDNEAPFRLQFTTDDYPAGPHTLNAVGYTTDGRELASNEITVNFVSAEKANQLMLRILVPVIGLVVLVTLAGAIGPLLTSRRQIKIPAGQPRKYGISGGTICPRCQRPFPLPFLSLNMGLGKLVACPHCGKWGIMRTRPLSELRQAEAAELEQARISIPTPEISEEEKLRRDIDDSRFQDS